MKEFRKLARKKGLTGFIPVLLIMVFSLVSLSCEDTIRYRALAPEVMFGNPGTFSGISVGFLEDPIFATVTVDTYRILAIDVSHSETAGFGDLAIDQMRNLILRHQTTDVDLSTGATLSAAGFLAAVNEAVDQADPVDAFFVRGASTRQFRDEEVDVVVMGSGIAGFAAAIRLREVRPDWHVVLIEKSGVVGGNTSRASVSVGGGWSRFTLNDSSNEHGGIVGPPAVQTATTNQHHANQITRWNTQHWMNFLYHGGARFIQGPNNSLGTAFGAARLADRRIPGGDVTQAALNHALQMGVDVRVRHDGYRLIQPGGSGTAVTGIEIGVNPSNPNVARTVAPRQHEYRYTLTTRQAVLIASGGFTHNVQLKQEFMIPGLVNAGVPQAEIDALRRIFIDDVWATAAPALTGDGQIMGRDAGAALYGMDAVLGTQRHPIRYHVIRVPHSRNGLSMASIAGNATIMIDGATGRRLARPDGHQAVIDAAGNVPWPHHTTWSEREAGGTVYSNVWGINNFRHHINVFGNLRDYFLSGQVLQDNSLSGLATRMGLGSAADQRNIDFVATMNQIMANANRYSAHTLANNINFTTQVNAGNNALAALSGEGICIPTPTAGTLAENIAAWEIAHADATCGLGDRCNSHPRYTGMRRNIGYFWGNHSGPVGPFFAFRSYPGLH